MHKKHTFQLKNTHNSPPAINPLPIYHRYLFLNPLQQETSRHACEATKITSQNQESKRKSKYSALFYIIVQDDPPPYILLSFLRSIHGASFFFIGFYATFWKIMLVM
mmetsp:Transcript_57045/g.84891  ORF Transcript_57045/g.84891 Transcript_57045/m.84891 type:complete len:107 (-) Transcript_57045:341-661(-)